MGKSIEEVIDWKERSNFCLPGESIEINNQKPPKQEVISNPAKPGLGGAPTRNTTLPSTAAERKQYPLASGLADYFPDALAAVAYVSYRGTQQHHPDKPMHWDRGKSSDEADTMLRHFFQRGTVDIDGIPHSYKMVWRALAFLQKEIEAEQAEKRLNNADRK